MIYYINFHIANFFSNSKKTKKNNNKDNLPNILINNKDFDSNCLINLKLMEMIEKKDNNNRLQTDFLDMKQKMLETYFNQRIFEIEMKQKIKDLEEGQKQTKITQPKTKGFLDEIPNTLRQILEKLKNVEEMQFEILQDYTKKTHYNSNDKILYVHPEDFLHINKALMQQKYKQLKN
ncbi:hypothetical protein [Candidatus Phytoplasma solani]|uniref:hypothetical protein n=1 Tax=Candidatus Phytoplasma solani TaxID=69896 RepID=UPI0032DAD7E3